MTPTVSVIVPNYNHSTYLVERINSILGQTCQDFELILLDDCSTDGSRDILISYSDNAHVSHIVFNEKNSGSPFAQWNKGIELAKGEWIWIAESDDWAEFDFLSVMLENARQHPNCGLVFSKARYMLDGKEMWHMEETGSVTEYSGENFVREKLDKANVIYNVSMVLFKRELFLRIDQTLYNDMKLCGDWFFYAQLCKYTDVLEIDKVCSNYRIHDGNESALPTYKKYYYSESIVILDYLRNTFPINPSAYSKWWGKQLLKDKKRFSFSSLEFIKILQQLFLKHTIIVIWYVFYRIKRAIYSNE